MWEAMSYHGHVGDSMGANHGNNVGINRVAFFCGGGSVWQKEGEYVCGGVMWCTVRLGSLYIDKNV